MKKTIFTLVMLLGAVIPVSAADLTSTVTGGNWSTGSTWIGDTVPTDTQTFLIQGGATVTAGSDVVYTGTAKHSDVAPSGTFQVHDGASVTMGRLNSLTTLGSGTNFVEITGTGSLLSVDRIGAATSTNLTSVSVNSGGVFETRGATAIYGRINIGTGGVARLAYPSFSTAGGLTLAGGTLIFPNSLTSTGSFSAWNTGTLVANGSLVSGTYGAFLGSSAVNGIFKPWNTNAGNVLDLSSKPTKQTFSIGSAVTGTQGTIAFDVYSAGDDDCDLFRFNSAGNLSLSSGVNISVSGVSLSGVSADYIGSSYLLFSGSTTFANINPTVLPSVFNIGGTDYTVGWTNTLNTDGRLTIASLVPEPSTVLALVSGIGLLVLKRRGRSRR